MKIREMQQSARPGNSEQIRASNLDVVHEDTASTEVKELYQQFRQDFGRPQVPGILQCFATHPQLLRHMMGLAKSMLFVEGALGRRHKEMISTFVSATNICKYCTDSHAYAFRVQGGSATALDAVLTCDLDSRSIGEKARALLHFAKKITESSHAITPADVEAMRAAGWTDLQTAEAVHVTALFATFNRVVNAFGLPSQELLKLLEQPLPDANHGVDHA
jgi:uncharacterized peroxidase-related enzyme